MKLAVSLSFCFFVQVAIGNTETCTENSCQSTVLQSLELFKNALGRVDGGWSEWTPWDSCSVTCGVGIQHRERSCDNPTPILFGQHCFGYNRDYKICMGPPCQNGLWSPWGSWSQCSTTCGHGIKHRFRKCANLASCEGPDFDSDVCIVKDCIEVYVRQTILLVSINGGLWGTVCDDVFDQNNNGAKVVCGMLGHNRNNGVYVDPGDYTRPDPMLLTSVYCTGSETSLMDCSYAKHANRCSDSEVAGVLCT